MNPEYVLHGLSNKALGRRIAEIRRRAGFSSRGAFSKRTGLSESHTKMVETGRRRPTEKSLGWMAVACNLTNDEFIHLEDDAFGFKAMFSRNPVAMIEIPGYAQQKNAMIDGLFQSFDFREDYELALDRFLDVPKRRQDALKNQSGTRPLVPPEIAHLVGQLYWLLKKADPEGERERVRRNAAEVIQRFKVRPF